jgi:hypothetical protein
MIVITEEIAKICDVGRPFSRIGRTRLEENQTQTPMHNRDMGRFAARAAVIESLSNDQDQLTDK